MQSRNVSNGGGNGDLKALTEASSFHHHQHPSAQKRNVQNHIPNSTKSIMIKTIPYFIALAFACSVLYHSSDHFQNGSLISYNPLPSQNSTTLPRQSSSTSNRGNYSDPAPGDEVFKGNLSPVSNNSSITPAQENLPTNISSPMHPQENAPSSRASDETEEAQLEKVLNRAAMENKTVIVTTLNAAWTQPNSLFDLLLESFKIGNGTQKFLNHLVVIALDQKAYNRCSEKHPYCYALRTEGIDFSLHEVRYKHPQYTRLVWRKIEFMHTILKLGYNAIFTDADVIWFRDPFLHFLKDADIQITSDHYGGSPTSIESKSNTGFYYVKSNSRTIQFFEFWLSSMHKFPKKYTQFVFNKIRFDTFVKKIGTKIRFLDTAFYGGFCEPSKDLNLVCTMHATCTVGLTTKLHRLRMLIDDWKMYMALSSDQRAKKQHTWSNKTSFVMLNV